MNNPYKAYDAMSWFTTTNTRMEKDNDRLESYYTNLLLLIAANRFRWKNLPGNIDKMYLEKAIITNGVVAFFKDETLDEYEAFMGSWVGFDNYYQPTSFNVVTPNGYYPVLKKDEFVPIWNNYLRVSDLPTIFMFAEQLADLRSAIIINARAQKTPILVTAKNRNQKNTLRNIFAKVTGNAPAIFTYSNPDPFDSLKTLDLKAPYVADKLYELTQNIFSEFLRNMGIPSNVGPGRERVLLAEENDANAQVYMMRTLGLHPRQDACEKINKKWGLNLAVEFNPEIIKIVDEVKTNGTLFDDTRGNNSVETP